MVSGWATARLAYLRRLPARKIKVDRSFMGAVGTDAGGEALLRSIVALGHSLGKRVVAEGVESEAQLAFLRVAGCDEAQGYHISRPVPAAEAERLLRSGAVLCAAPLDHPPAEASVWKESAVAASPRRYAAGSQVQKWDLTALLRALDDQRAKAAEARIHAAHIRERHRLVRAQVEATLAASAHLVRRVREPEPDDHR